MATVRSYRDLEAWKRSMELAEGCYRFTERFPRAEVFGLAAHIRKSAVSVASNVAEGHSRRSTAAFVSFIGIAMGSQAELETQIELARRLGFGQEADAARLLEMSAEVGRILNGLRAALVDRPETASDARTRKASS